ncbi:hypothetical protein CAC42_6909 [Sphaceloma murrayae]|uniref:Uncharacterized protein n=1 Tax=Sphaceloma murrayae TaxID=2082308 RepID=A0A2K1QQ56_9PEZI|nr:hypothetical protein CAC42_6909 [Sphaceloma murrayae]
MSTHNGHLTPSKQALEDPPSSGTKRKRSEAQEELDAKQPTAATAQENIHDPQAGSAIFDDILAILYQSEVGPTVLSAVIPTHSSCHTPKKAKLSAPQSTTVSEKVAEGSYRLLDELQEDVDSICEAQIARIRKPEEGTPTKSKRLSEDDVAQMQNFMSFQGSVRDLVRSERLSARKQSKIADGTIKLHEVKDESEAVGLVPQAGRTVLSLYGHAPTPKQLFSSLQDDASTDLTLEELGLPAMLTATRVLPLTQDEPAKSKVPSFGEVFASPSSLPQLQPPPKLPKAISGRNPSIAFVSQDRPPNKSLKKLPYQYQALSVGAWLRYGTTPRRKEKMDDRKRDRSGSISERGKPDEPVAPSPKEEDLFLSAYSSFAPSCDNSRSVLSAESRSLLWWQRNGKRRLQSLFSVDLAADEAVAGRDQDEDQKASADREIEMFEEAIRDFDESTMEHEILDGDKTPAEMEAQELLLEINNLLHALASHQQIRNSSAPPHSRTPSISSPSPMRSTLIGTPSEPSPDEIETYRSIKERLAEVVARLPPYLVAKMEGEQIEDLRVKTTILLRNQTVRGVLEDDQLTRLAKATAAAAAATGTSAARASSNTTYSQYPRTSSMSGGRAALTPQSYQGGRPSVNYARTSSNLATATPSAQSNRNSYTQLGAQTAPVNRTQLQPASYGQPPSAQFYQRPGYNQPANNAASGSPQPTARNWGNQYSNSQTQYQGVTQFKNTIPYGQNLFGQQSQPQSYSQQSYGQQRPSSNGRSTPVSNIAPAPPRVNSPMKAIQSTEIPRPGSATPQPPTAHMNGVQMNGA